MGMRILDRYFHDVFPFRFVDLLKPFYKEVMLLVSFSFFIVLFALLLSVAALLREVRLRRAVERLLRRLLELWRKKDHE